MFQARRMASFVRAFIPDKRGQHPSGPIRSVIESINLSAARRMASFERASLPDKRGQHPSGPIRSLSDSINLSIKGMALFKKYSDVSIEQEVRMRKYPVPSEQEDPSDKADCRDRFVPRKPLRRPSGDQDQVDRDGDGLQLYCYSPGLREMKLRALKGSLFESLPDPYHPTKSLVIDRMNKVLGSFLSGFRMKDVRTIDFFFLPLDFELFGVKNVEELIFKLDELKEVFLYKEPRCNYETYAMAGTTIKGRQYFLRPRMEKFLNKYGGEVTISSFEKLFMDTCRYEWNPNGYGLNDLGDLCRVLEDTVEEGVNSKGEKVIKLKHTGQGLQSKKKEEK